MKLSVLFFELIKVSLKKKQQFLSVPSEEEWQELFTYARKQALIGVLFTGIQLLPESQRPHRELLIKWYILTEQIKKQNTLLNIRALETSAYFTDHGFANCVLKGRSRSAIKRFASSLKRNVRFLRYYPSEVLWDVPFRIWLYMWRKWKRYI